jgi:3'-5' exoribonuclease
MSRKLLKDVRRGESLSGIFLVQGANFKQARNGKHFIQMSLRDYSASVKALRWEASREEFRRLERHPFLYVNGRVEEYQGSLQVIVDEMDNLTAEDARVNPSEFLPRSRFDLDGMLEALDGFVAGISDPGIRKVVENVMARPGIRKGFREAPAGKALHHACIGGLLEHVLSLCRLAEKLLDHYEWLDRSVFMAGVILHDVGKIEELSFQTGFGYTDEGQMVGHIVMAAGWIDEAAREVPGLSRERVVELKHLIVSHHGKLEFGSPRMPMTAEAIALHYLDNIDAKLAGYEQSYRDTQPEADGDRWGEYSHMQGTRLYFPRNLDASHRKSTRPAPAEKPGPPPPEGGNPEQTEAAPDQLPF